jgi:hypothetical protein
LPHIPQTGLAALVKSSVVHPTGNSAHCQRESKTRCVGSVFN